MKYCAHAVTAGKYIRHIVEECPQTGYKRGTKGLHEGDEEAMNGISNIDVHL